MVEIADAHLEQLLARVPRQLDEALVDLQESPVGADLDATDPEVVEEAAERGRGQALEGQQGSDACPIVWGQKDGAR